MIVATLGTGALLLLSGATPAAASAASLSTQAATGVGIASATLNGTATGFPQGTYCSFAYEETSPTVSNVLEVSNEPALQCGTASGTGTVTYSMPFVGLTANSSYIVFAVACQSPQLSNGSYYCTSGSNLAIDPCNTSSPSTCPTFTTSEPSATTDTQTSVLGSSATLNGTLNIQDLTGNQSGLTSDNVGWYFQYSSDSTLAASTQTTQQQLSASNESSTVPVSAQIAGLSPGTTYYYRVVLDLSAEVTGTAGGYFAYGAIMSFTTGGRVITGSATQLGSSSATLNGEVVAGNDPLSYHFVYSTSNATSAGVLQGTSAGGGTVATGQDQLVSASLSGLLTGFSYYAQIVATDQSTGVVLTGQILSFTTAGGSCPAGATEQQDTQVPGTGFVVSGCFAAPAGAPSGSSPWTGYGSITVNGLPFSGPSSSTATFDGSNLTLADGYSLALGTTPVSVAGTAGLSFGYTSTAACATPGASGCDSTLNVIPDPSTAFFGFPVLGSLTVTAHASTDSGNPGGADVSLAALGLPSLFGGVTATGSASVSEGGALSAISAQLGDATIGPLSLPELAFSYTPSSNSWSATADLMFPLAKVGISGSVTISDGSLTALSAAYSGPGIPLGETGLELNAVNFEATFNPFSLGGGVGVGFGPEVLGTSLLEGNVNLLVAYNSPQTLTGLPGIPNGYTLPDVPLTITLSGNLQLLGFIQLAQAQTALYAIPGDPLITASAQFGQPLLANCPAGGQFGFDNQFGIAGDAAGGDFNLVGSGQDEVYLCGLGSYGIQASAAISSVGFDLCGSITDVGVLGYGVDWSAFSSLPTDPRALLSGLQLYGSGTCDVSPYEANIPLPAGIARAAAAGHAMRIAALRLRPGLPFEVLRIRGRGQAPLVSLRGPHGLRFAMRAGQGGLRSPRGYLVIADPFNDTTYVELDHPAAGRYAVSMAPGSAPVLHVSASAGLAPPRVRARLSGRGDRRVLRWQARARPGQQLVFREVGAGGDRLLLSTRRTRGVLGYRLLPGARGRRQLIVQVLDAGHLQRVIHIAGYFGPTYRRPARPLRASALRRGATVTVSWKQPGQRPPRWLVLVVERDGARVLHPSRAPRLVLRGAAARGALRVTVTAQNALGQRGPSVLTRVRKPPRRPVRHRAPKRRHR